MGQGAQGRLSGRGAAQCQGLSLGAVTEAVETQALSSCRILPASLCPCSLLASGGLFGLSLGLPGVLPPPQSVQSLGCPELATTA